MKQKIGIAIALIGICGIFLYAKYIREYPADEPEIQEDISGEEQETEEIIETGEQYSLVETEYGEYVITLYDKGNNVVHTETYSKLPWCAEITDNILQIGLTGGDIGSLIL